MLAITPKSKEKERQRFRKSVGQILKFYQNKKLGSTEHRILWGLRSKNLQKFDQELEKANRRDEIKNII